MDRPEPRSRSGRRKAHTARTWLIIAMAAALLFGALAAIVRYTETPPFCRTCHEMESYYQAWNTGGHKSVACVDCHIDPGLVAHGLHKFVALKEVWGHFTTTPVFPGQPVEMPDSRCVRCHQTIAPKPGSKFDHVLHAKQGRCVLCHATSGHAVSLDSLRAAGILAPGASSAPKSGPVGRGALLAEHPTVECQRCHDLARTPCSTCHRATHEPRGECSTCHRPAAAWTFQHPRSQHDYRSQPCAKCHPNGYRTYFCTCHGTNSPKGD